MSESHKHSKISNYVKTQIPSYLRKTRPLFVELMEAYFEYLEQTEVSPSAGKVVERAKSLRNYNDVDTTFDSFILKYYKQFLALVPRDTAADKVLLLKRIKDFYRAKGTEKSYRFLIRLLSTGTNEAEFYYPKNDILRASDSTWYIQKTLRVLYIKMNGVDVPESEIADFYKFTGLQITGADSGATAIVDKAEHFYDGGFLIDELTLSSISGTFSPGEIISTTYVDDSNVSHVLTATINSGVVSGIQVTAPGYGYSIGDPVVIEPAENSPGTGAIAQVSEITRGSINTVSVLYGGSGYRANDALLISGGGGSGASGIIASVEDSGVYHPNVYTIDISTISLEANTQIGNTTYTNLNAANANTAIQNAINTFLYANTGPATFVSVIAVGEDYTSIPTISVIGNTRIQALGILGRMNVVSSGANYNVGEMLVFTNVLGGHGIAAAASIATVNGTGAIMNVAYQTVTGFPLGGVGYDNEHLPVVTINTAAGTGANIVVDSILGFGANLAPSLTTIGEILAIDVISGGSGYNTAPTINLTASGSGTANARANILLGLYSYPGRYIDDRGHISAFNFLQDRDYYQNYSYVIRVDESLRRYKKALLDLVHPTGTKMFAEYLDVLDDVNITVNAYSANTVVSEYYSPNTIYFDGASYMKTNSQGFSIDTTAGILSVWVYPEEFPVLGERKHIISFGDANVGFLALENTGSANSGSGIRVAFVTQRSNGANAFMILSDENAWPIESNDFIHILASWNTSVLNECKIYISGANALGTRQITGSTPLQGANLVIGGSQTGQLFKGSLAELYISNTWANLDLSATRSMFSNNLLPLNLTTTVTGLPPVLYLKSNAAYANVSETSGNVLSIIVGTILDSNVNPLTH